MAKIIDACGLACPAPVLLAKDAVEGEGPAELTVLVDNQGSLENVSRFLTTKGYRVSSHEENGVFHVVGIGDGSIGEAATGASVAQTAEEATTQKVMVLVASDCLGSGDDTLGRKLMVSYLNTIKEMGPELWHLVFVNAGVKLTTKDSPVLSVLREYEKNGVIVLACGTCLEHFGLTAEKEVGATTNMLDIVTATQLADKVITVS